MPRNTTSSVFFYVYVLESLKDGKRYIGYTNNLKKRIEEHKEGISFSTKARLPLRLIYFEGCFNQEDAKRREHYLKTTQGASPVIQLLMRSAQKRRRRQKMIYGARFLGLRLIQYQGHKKTFGAGR